MFLKSLTLKGFKSFADATSLDFEPGVTVVVGPNGSGKSNVVDAIAWVLGAQAPSAVRSQKMDDVIFAGTTKRSALGRAEVSLTLDNSMGLLPIDFTEVTLTRTLFRTGESEYAINGAPCRLLDLQELLSDTGVGRQQHVIVSQGQIDAVLNARPEDRRSVIEEAAGVLKYRRRKEKAERRLRSTEANLTRVQDLLREVRRQLRPLERQADAARRHGAVAAELAALQRYTAGRELAALRERQRAGVERQHQLTSDDTAARAELAGLDASISATEARLAAQGGDDLGDTVARYEALRERARGLAALLAERRRAIERERASFVDQAVVATLESEAARLAADLATVEAEAERLLPDAERLAEAEAELESRRSHYHDTWSEGVAPPTGEAAEVRGALTALRSAAEQADRERQRLATRLASLTERTSGFAATRVEIQQRLAAADRGEEALVARVDQADTAVSLAEAELAEAEAEVARLSGQQQAWQARADALELALDEARARAGAQRLAGIDGVLGSVLELIDVDPGWEAVVEVALGDALAAVVVADPAAGRRAAETLRSGDVSGALVVLGRAQSSAVAAAPKGVGDPVRPRVRSHRGDLDGLLDALVGHVVRIDDWDRAVEASLQHPDLVVVTATGDRLGPVSWRVGMAGSGATGAALDEARQQAEQAAAELAVAREHTAAAGATVTARRADATEAHAALDHHDQQLATATSELQRLDAERQGIDVEIDSVAKQIDELTGRIDTEQARIAELERRLPELEAADAQSHALARAMAEARDQLEEHATAVGVLRTDLEVRAAGIEQRRSLLRSRHDEVERRLVHLVAEREEAEVHRLDLDRRELLIDRLVGIVADRLAHVEANLARLRDRRRAQSEAARAIAAELEGVRRQRQAAEARLAELREHAHRAELETAEVGLRLEALLERIRTELDTSPDTVLATECPELAEGVSPPARIRELEREIKLMGPINPLALQEFEELQERHQFLQDQLDDIRNARRDLARVIRSIDEEIVNVFASAYADVSTNFTALFTTLFPGGEGRLKLTDPDNLLETGIEVEAKPSGKNVKKLSLLSGGERSLTALAFLFAVFRSRPSPFYVMDEVEAALDDLNLHRFLSLVDEFRNEAQLLIVSHQKRTMEAADILYGVTMQPGGSSKVVSERSDVVTARGSDPRGDAEAVLAH